MAFDPSGQALLTILDTLDNRENLTRLLRQLRTGVGVVPFVGAGLSIPHGFPGWTKFLTQQARKAGIGEEVRGRITNGEYEEAAEDLLEALGPRTFYDAIEQTFGRFRLANRIITGAACQLPPLTRGPIVTTNFDRVLEMAFDQAQRPLEPVWGAHVDLTLKGLHEDRSFLLKIHGDADARSARILTRRDYEEHYGQTGTTQAAEERKLPRALRLILTNRPLLFVGCSLNRDRLLTVLRHVYIENPDIAHYAVVEAPRGGRAFRERARFLSEHGIRPIWYPRGRHDAIEPLLAHLAASVGAGRTDSPPYATVVPPSRRGPDVDAGSTFAAGPATGARAFAGEISSPAMSGRALEESRHPRGLENALRRIEALGIGGLGVRAPDVAAGAPSIALPALPPHHVTRQAALGVLDDMFGEPPPPGVRRTVAVSGAPGQGKSLLALDYAYRVTQGLLKAFDGTTRQVYRIVLDAPADQASELIHALAGLLHSTGMRLDVQQRAGLVRETLSRTPCLLIVDNVCSDEQWSAPAFQEALPGPACRILATTRADFISGARTYVVEPMSSEQARGILATFRPDAGDAGHARDIERIATELGGLALALSAVGAYMSLEPSMTWAEAADWLASAATDDIDAAAAVHAATGYPKRTRAVLDALQGALPEAERRALEFAAFLPQDVVPALWLEDLLTKCAASDAGRLHVTLGRRPSGRPQTPAGVVEHLARLGLLTGARGASADPAGSRGGDRRTSVIWWVHRLHARRARERTELVAGEADAVVETLVGYAAARARWLTDGASDDQAAHRDVSDRCLDPVLRWEVDTCVQVAIAMQARRPATAEVGQLWQAAAEMLLPMYRPDAAESLLREALLLRRRLFTGDHADLANNLQALGWLLAASQQTAEAESLLREALAMQRRMFPGDHRDVAATLLALAHALTMWGRAANAEALAHEALAMHRRLFPEERRQLATCVALVALILALIGRQEEAESLYGEASAMRQRLMPADPSAGMLLGMIAMVLGRTGEAESLIRDALTSWQRLLPGNHGVVATSLTVLGMLAQMSNRLAEAESRLRESLEIWKRLFPGDHADVATALDNLGSLLDVSDRADDAESFLRDALAMRQRLFPGDHPEVAESLSNVGDALEALDRHSEAEAHYRDALTMGQRLFVGDHKQVARSLDRLALLLDRSGRPNEAEPLYRDALAMRQRLVGGDHENVAARIDRLASVLAAQGRADEAVAHYRDALAMRQRLATGDHEDLAASMDRLASVLAILDRLDEAEALYRDALAMRQRLVGGDHEDLAASMDRLAAVLKTLRQAREAANLYRAALAMRQRLLPGDHPDIESSLRRLASTVKMLGRAGEARSLERDALAMQQRLLLADPRHELDVYHVIEITFWDSVDGVDVVLDSFAQEIRLQVPAGIAAGQRMRLFGEGRAGIDSKRGDLYVAVSIDDDPVFRRDGRDLFCTLYTSAAALEQGTILEVPVRGTRPALPLNIPANTTPGARFRIPSEGVPSVMTPEELGDLYVTVEVG